MKKELDITYYRFLSEVRSFLSKLLKDPIKAQPSVYLKNRDVTRKKLIDDLLKRDVLERHEKILDPTNSDEKEAKYVVKYKVHKKDFEKRIHRLYIKYFEKNINEEAELRSCANLIGVVGGGKKGETADRWAEYVNNNSNGYKPSLFKNEEEMKQKILNGPDGETYKKRGGIKEDGAGGGAAAGGEGGIGGATSTFSVGGDTTRGDMGYDSPLGMVERRPIGGRPKEKEKGKKDDHVLGKTIYAESKKPKKIHITEEQFNRILEEEGLGAGGATTTTSVASSTTDGQLGPVRPGCMTFKKSNGKPDDSAFERKPGFSCRTVGDK